MNRRLYAVSPDPSCNPSDITILNEQQALEDGKWLRRRVKVTEDSQPFFIGNPEFKEKLQLKVGVIARRHLDIYGFDRFFISNRVKYFLEDIDRAAFEFTECAAFDKSGRAIEPYWLMSIIRIVNKFDEEKSNFITYAERNPEDPEASSNPAISVLNDIYLDENFPKNYHAFYFNRYRNEFIFDETIVDAWRRQKFSGAFFTPLQRPVKEDKKRMFYFSNWSFWENDSEVL